MATEWGYSTINGPSTWQQLYPSACGDRQSPVDITPVDLKAFNPLQRLSWKYIPENTESVTNPGYSWKVQVNGKGSDLSGGPLEGKYVLEQFHCHWGATDNQGSEHTINGKKFSGELHLVHWNSTKYSSFEEACKHPDGLCVLGILLKPGRTHYELNKIVAKLSSIQFKDQVVNLGVPVDPGSFIPQCSGYWTYQGSLTTPPCSECVIWIVFQDPIEVSHEQLHAFRSLKSYCPEEGCPCDDFKGFVIDNFRPTHPIGRREIRECSQ